MGASSLVTGKKVPGGGEKCPVPAKAGWQKKELVSRAICPQC